MPTYLIEIPHSENTFECKQVIKLFVESGSHLLANAQWGCKSGVHKSWFLSDFDNREEALQYYSPILKTLGKYYRVDNIQQSRYCSVR